MITVFAILIFFGFPAQAEEPPAPVPVQTPATAPVLSPASEEYEIDYEEEVAPSEEAPPPKRPVIRSQGNSTAVQGSRAKDRFTPILKSETKSVYKKGGKQLDVDPD